MKTQIIDYKKAGGDNKKMLKVFSSDNCEYCNKLKAYLDNKGVDYSIIDIDASEENYSKLISVSGQTGVPVTLSEDGIYVIGYDPKSIDGLTS